MLEESLVQLIAKEARVQATQASRAIELLNSGATIPFLARYRQDATGGLSEEKLEFIADRRDYYSALSARRAAILASLEKQEQVPDDLKPALEKCVEKVALEDLYLPHRKAKRTKATVAREKGLMPLADYLATQEAGEQTIEEFAATFVRAEKAIVSVDEALEGARQILAERIAVDLPARQFVRQYMLKHGSIAAHPTKNAEGKQTKFEAYYAFSEPIEKIPSHRFLAVHRGVREGFLRMELALDDAEVLRELNTRFIKSENSPFAAFLRPVIADAYNRLLRPSIENEVIGMVRERSDAEAIRVFRENARNLLLAPPAGALTVIGIDPGQRSACNIAVVNAAGMFLESAAITPQSDAENSEKIFLALVAKHDVKAVAIGNGAGSREISRFIKQALTKAGVTSVFWLFVNEAGAAIYASSKLGRDEFPHLDTPARAAVSIARRLQDPLSELVKIEPRHVGVGQYQHDVSQKSLRESLHRTVSSCVNAVGVDLNTCTVHLLQYVSGLQEELAQRIVEFRTQHSGFRNRNQLLEVAGVGPKVFEQCAGFLRVSGSDNLLDGTAIHPEAYPTVERVASTLGIPVSDLVARPETLNGLEMSQFESDGIGHYTLRDIRDELLQRGRDPRTEFRIPKFIEGVDTVQDLQEGMEIEGIVTNVTDFGAFIDVGVHQDGLVHLSELANRFVQDPRDVVKVGEIVKVKVIKVDKALPRISLSIKALLPPPEPRQPRRHTSRRPAPEKREPEAVGAPSTAAPAVNASEAPDGFRSRRPRPEHRDGGDERRPRPAPRPDSRPQGGHDDRPRGGGRNSRREKEQVAALKSAVRGGKHGASRPPEKAKSFGDDAGPLNTQLADQLAALRGKLGG